MPFIPLSDSEVASQVRQLVAQGRIRWTRHAEERMALRGVDKGQIKECLMRGQFTERPTIPNRAGGIEYLFRMNGQVDGEDLAVAAALDPETKVIVITVFLDES